MPRAAGHTYRVEVAPSDDIGHQDAFVSTGEWRVVASD